MFNFNMLNADLNIQLNLPVDQPIHNGKYVIRGIFPITKGKVEKVNIPSTIGKADIQWKVQQGDILNNCRSLRDISAKIMVSNDNYSSAYKDFKYLSNFGIISVCG
ncbi:MAG: hypothetical protein LW807_00370 [Proteobacteria bacterium]|nr:hypothetical protein [Pseudomonadota bacterium]